MTLVILSSSTSSTASLASTFACRLLAIIPAPLRCHYDANTTRYTNRNKKSIKTAQNTAAKAGKSLVFMAVFVLVLLTPIFKFYNLLIYLHLKLLFCLQTRLDSPCLSSSLL
jgi:hypothetical protein